MQQDEAISQAYQGHRPYLIDLAFRMLGDIGAAEDVVQDAFSRLMGADLGQIEDCRGWLIVVTSRLCLDHIKSAPWRRERPADMAARSYRGNNECHGWMGVRFQSRPRDQDSQIIIHVRMVLSAVPSKSPLGHRRSDLENPHSCLAVKGAPPPRRRS